MYLDYDYYKISGGKMAESVFPTLEKKAEYKLNYWTQDRLKLLTLIPDSVKDLMVEMINKYNDFDELDIKGATSVSNDGVSVSYKDAVTLDSVNKELYNLAVEMLPIELISAVVVVGE